MGDSGSVLEFTKVVILITNSSDRYYDDTTIGYKRLEENNEESFIATVKALYKDYWRKRGAEVVVDLADEEVAELKRDFIAKLVSGEKFEFEMVLNNGNRLRLANAVVVNGHLFVDLSWNKS